MFSTSQNAEIEPCMLLFWKSRYKPNLGSTSNMVFPRFGDLGRNRATFWACACKLSWTLFTRLSSVPIGGGKKWEFRDWTDFTMEDKFHSRYVIFFLIFFAYDDNKSTIVHCADSWVKLQLFIFQRSISCRWLCGKCKQEIKLYYSITMIGFRLLWKFNYPLFSL